MGQISERSYHSDRLLPFFFHLVIQLADDKSPKTHLSMTVETLSWNCAIWKISFVSARGNFIFCPCSDRDRVSISVLVDHSTQFYPWFSFFNVWILVTMRLRSVEFLNPLILRCIIFLRLRKKSGLFKSLLSFDSLHNRRYCDAHGSFFAPSARAFVMRWKKKQYLFLFPSPRVSMTWSVEWGKIIVLHVQHAFLCNFLT